MGDDAGEQDRHRLTVLAPRQVESDERAHANHSAGKREGRGCRQADGNDAECGRSSVVAVVDGENETIDALGRRSVRPEAAEESEVRCLAADEGREGTAVLAGDVGSGHGVDPGLDAVLVMKSTAPRPGTRASTGIGLARPPVRTPEQ